MKKIFIGIIASSILTFTSYAEKKHRGSNGDHVAGKHQKQNNRNHNKHLDHNNKESHKHNKNQSKIITTRKIINNQNSRHTQSNSRHTQSNSRHTQSNSRHQNHHKDHYNYSVRYNSHSQSGYYEYVNKKVWVPARCEKVWVPARYEYRRGRCGKFIRVQVCNGYYRSHSVPGYYDYTTVKVWRQKSCQPRHTVSIYWGR